jgi:hypothetical protein
MIFHRKGVVVMLKLNLQNLQIENKLTGYQQLNCVLIDGNDVMTVKIPDTQHDIVHDAHKATELHMEIKMLVEQIHKKKINPKYSNFDDMETLREYRSQVEVMEKQLAEYKKLLAECESTEAMAVYSGTRINLATGEETEVHQLELPVHTKISIQKARFVLDVLAMDDAKLEKDNAWLAAHGYDFALTTTPAAPYEISGTKTLEEIVLQLAER